MKRILRLAFITLLMGGAAGAEIGEIDPNAGPPPAVSERKALSALWLHAKTRVTVLMRDAKGRRTGVDPRSRKVLQEIPDSTAQVEYIENPYTGDAHAEAEQRINIEPAPGGVYELQLYGLQPGPYELTISALASNGSSQPSKEIEGLISEGEVKTLHLRFDPAPNAGLSVVEERR